MNLEDDIVPVKNFVREAFAYVKVREEAHEDWSSLQVWAFEIPDTYLRTFACFKGLLKILPICLFFLQKGQRAF